MKKIYKRISAYTEPEFKKKIKKALKSGWKEWPMSYCFCGSMQATLYKEIN